MSYKITSLYKLPHGHAVAVCLPEVWQYMVNHLENCIDYRGSNYLNSIFVAIAETLGFTSVENAITFFRTMLAEMEMKYPVASDCEAELELLIKSVNPLRLKNNPIRLTDYVIKQCYENILK